MNFLSDLLAEASSQVQGDPESAAVSLVIVIIELLSRATGIFGYSLRSVHKAKYYNKIHTYC